MRRPGAAPVRGPVRLLTASSGPRCWAPLKEEGLLLCRSERERLERARTGAIRSRLSSAVDGRSRPALHVRADFLRGRGRHRSARWGRGADFLPPQTCRGTSGGSGSPIVRLRSPRPCNAPRRMWIAVM
ncbi:hypothetical protein NDU88_005232 [Pleurodeles waltl]|uniref:Uncharacterized protein n=1 Tax=Pleurodeles waltl TaxID=8319 RepID=A0AAV7RIG5_PLEWA|nr:hypothetical protein NDU88_005232 [Pleurodeles waltl]